MTRFFFRLIRDCSKTLILMCFLYRLEFNSIVKLYRHVILYYLLGDLEFLNDLVSL